MKCDDGKWSSPRGEEKIFKSKDFSLKWHGPEKEKLQIMKDNEERSLQCTLEACAQANGVLSQDENMTINEKAHGRRYQQTTPTIRSQMSTKTTRCAEIVMFINIKMPTL